jgi:hypothetical protein
MSLKWRNCESRIFIPAARTGEMEAWPKKASFLRSTNRKPETAVNAPSVADSTVQLSYSILNTAPAESIALVMCSSVACISARDLTLPYRM